MSRWFRQRELKRQGRLRTTTVARFEALEPRRLLAVDFTWTGGASTGDWSEPDNWDGPPGMAPGVNEPFVDTATFDLIAGQDAYLTELPRLAAL